MFFGGLQDCSKKRLWYPYKWLVNTALQLFFLLLTCLGLHHFCLKFLAEYLNILNKVLTLSRSVSLHSNFCHFLYFKILPFTYTRDHTQNLNFYPYCLLFFSISLVLFLPLSINIPISHSNPHTCSLSLSL